MQEQYICKTFISVKIPPLSYECNHSIVMLSYCRHMFIRTAFSFNSLRKQEANKVDYIFICCAQEGMDYS